MTKKRLTYLVTVSVPLWMTKNEARREVRTLINDQCNWMDYGPQCEEVDNTTVRVISIKSPTELGR